ncbi:MAG TPA: hypothetical protein VEA35_06750 [Ramlibacter sp.]|nr:hypothetical protein [Ramlibacter sp.]
MHGAPSVSYPVGRPFGAGAWLLGLWAAGLGLIAAWSWVDASPGWRQLLGSVAVLASGAWAAWLWRCRPRGELAWDGGAWTWQGEPTAGGVEVCLDLQGAMLLRCPAPSPVQWLWLERSAAPARWDDIRRAVYSRANPDAMQRAEPPSAPP